jgi:hypothetical protein
MRFKLPNCRRLQGAADARRRARRRTFVLQVPDNKADAVPCERLPLIYYEPNHLLYSLSYIPFSSIVSHFSYLANIFEPVGVFEPLAVHFLKTPVLLDFL